MTTETILGRSRRAANTESIRDSLLSRASKRLQTISPIYAATARFYDFISVAA
jgi:hypothetical protein